MTLITLTEKGEQRLREELEHLKGVERPRFVEAIADAREQMSDRKDAKYANAIQQWRLTESRIAELERKLAKAKIADGNKEPNRVGGKHRVVPGTTVVLLDYDRGKRITVQVVEETEADLNAGLISAYSPFGRALLGKERGDIATVLVPFGEKGYEIIEVGYD